MTLIVINVGDRLVLVRHSELSFSFMLENVVDLKNSKNHSCGLILVE
jgi:hypothetical protein